VTEVLQLPLYGAAGAVAGLVAGLFGLGGGVVLVPALWLLYAQQGFPPQFVSLSAVATSLASITVTAVASAWAHWRLGALDLRTTFGLLPGVVLGSVVGAWLAERLPGSWLKALFAGYLLVVAGQLLSFQPRPGRVQPKPSGQALAGGIIGILSAMLGIGGGTLTVPFLVWCSLPMRVAVAVSSALGLPIALAGTFSYAVLGWGAPGLPPGSIGYVYLPAFFGVIAASIVTAPLGARLAHCLSAEVLKRLFALSLVVISLKILYSLW
jgi:uncharacterized membrane protein YfcA